MSAKEEITDHPLHVNASDCFSKVLYSLIMLSPTPLQKVIIILCITDKINVSQRDELAIVLA